MSVVVELLPDAPIHEEYDAFLENCPGATLYHSSRYRHFLESVLDCKTEYMIAREEGRITGCVPVAVASGPYGDVLNSLPFFGSYGAVLARTPQAQVALAEAWRDRSCQPNVAAAVMIENPFSGDSLVDNNSVTHWDRRICQVTQLGGLTNVNTLLSRIEGSARRNIRRASTSGISVFEDPGDLVLLEKVHRENMQLIGGRAKPQRFFELLPRVFRPGIDYTIWVASADSQPVAALLVFFFKEFVEYFIPATEQSARELQPLSAILCQAMLKNALGGRSVWNWGGTWLAQDGVYRFKRKWAAEDVPYRYAITLRHPGLLERSPHQLQELYPWFFVAPYGALRQGGS